MHADVILYYFKGHKPSRDWVGFGKRCIEIKLWLATTVVFEIIQKVKDYTVILCLQDLGQWKCTIMLYRHIIVATLASNHLRIFFRKRVLVFF